MGKLNTYRDKLIKLNNCAKKNSKCREKRNIVSCCQCKDYESCNSNGYDKLNEDLKKTAKNISYSEQLKIREELH